MKRIKRFSILLFTAIFLIVFIPLPFTPGYTVSKAATVKISKTSLTLVSGKTATLKITGTTKSVKWASSKKAVATVSSKGKVTAKSAGTATITATVNGKKYVCKVTVMEAFSAAKAAKNIKSTESDLGNGVVTVLENDYIYPVSLSATAVYYDESGDMIGTSSADNYYFEKGKKCALYLTGPYDANYDSVKYNSYKITYAATQLSSSIKSNLSDILLDSNFGADNVMVSVKNNGKLTAEFTLVSIVFYNEGNVVGYDYTYTDANAPGNTSYLQFSYPHNENYETIQPDDFEVFVNGSYYY